MGVLKNLSGTHFHETFHLPTTTYYLLLHQSDIFFAFWLGGFSDEVVSFCSNKPTENTCKTTLSPTNLCRQNFAEKTGESQLSSPVRISAGNALQRNLNTSNSSSSAKSLGMVPLASVLAPASLCVADLSLPGQGFLDQCLPNLLSDCQMLLAGSCCSLHGYWVCLAEAAGLILPNPWSSAAGCLLHFCRYLLQG